MPTTTFLATAPDGSVLKRTSQTKAYTFMVAGLPSIETAKAAVLRPSNIEGHRSNFYYFRAQLGPSPRHRPSAEELDRYRRAIEGCPDADAYVARKTAEGLAAVEARRVAGDFDRWRALTWCSRRDLAESQRAARAREGFAEVRVLPVEVKA